MLLKKLINIFLTLVFLCAGFFSFAQEEAPIELKGADELESADYKGEEANLLKGNVRVEHDGSKMRCDKAYLFGDGGNFDAFGRVRINQPSGMTVTGDSLFYDTKTKIAKFRGNVRVVNGRSTITTNYLDFDTENETAWYYGGGKINDDGTRLSSGTGFYDSKQAFYSFKQDVKVLKDGNTIESDTLKYASGSKKTYFFGPTTVTSKDQTLYAENGVYNTVTQEGWFSENPWVKSEEYKLYGDSLYYNNLEKYGYAIKNVKLESFKEDADIYGDIAITEGKKNRSTVIGHSLLVDRSEKDTTYISADTLISVEDTTLKRRDVFAFRSVKIIKGNLHGVCDSLVYEESDSTISFYYDPILWNTTTQITADSLKVSLTNGAVDRMNGYQNSFLISQSLKDTSRYDQVKGIDMIAYFKESALNNLDVNGNGESVYYAYDDEDALIGLNSVVCANMKMFMVENDMDNIRFYDRPIAHFIPPHLIKEENRFVKGFKWRPQEKPTINLMLENIAGRDLVDKATLIITQQEDTEKVTPDSLATEVVKKSNKELKKEKRKRKKQAK